MPQCLAGFCGIFFVSFNEEHPMKTLDEFRPFVLRLMQDGQSRHLRQIVEAVCKEARLSAEEMKERLPSGQGRAENRIDWACFTFMKAGLLERVKRATYQITQTGRDFFKKWQHADKITEKDFVGLPLWDAYQQNLQAQRKQNAGDSINSSAFTESPESLAIQAVAEMENQTAVELLERLCKSTPEFFEKAVIEVLLGMGYGGKENLAEHVGQSHDGGIDGIIKQDPLGIRNIYIQAKRYGLGNNVGRPEIQGFAGALQGHGDDCGVFITTSAFTQDAEDYVRKLKGKVILIDGQHLATLMIRYHVGIQTRRMLEIVEIDEDFFE